MLGFFEKRKLKQRLYSVPVLLVLLVVASFLGTEAYQAYRKSKVSADRLDQQAAQLEALRAREADLAEEVDRLSTERGIEREIREKYDVGREGEGVIVLVDQKDISSGTEGEEEKRGFWSRLFGVFK